MPTGSDFSAVMLSGDNSFQSSSKMSGNPQDLLQDAKDCVLDHANLVHAYGFNQPIATLGSHPWLRDELADSTELEPANAEPKVNFKIPKINSV